MLPGLSSPSGARSATGTSTNDSEHSDKLQLTRHSFHHCLSLALVLQHHDRAIPEIMCTTGKLQTKHFDAQVLLNVRTCRLFFCLTVLFCYVCPVSLVVLTVGLATEMRRIRYELCDHNGSSLVVSRSPLF